MEWWPDLEVCCAICHEPIGDAHQAGPLPRCGHAFHHRCLLASGTSMTLIELRRECPVCKAELPLMEAPPEVVPTREVPTNVVSARELPTYEPQQGAGIVPQPLQVQSGGTLAILSPPENWKLRVGRQKGRWMEETHMPVKHLMAPSVLNSDPQGLVLHSALCNLEHVH